MVSVSRLIKLVQPSDLIKSTIKRQEIKDQIITDLKKVANVLPANYRDVLIYICTVLESTIQKKDGISKLDLLLEILQDLYGELTPELRVEITDKIEHLLSRGMIKKIGILRIALSYALEMVLKIAPLFL